MNGWMMVVGGTGAAEASASDSATGMYCTVRFYIRLVLP